jgi:glyoxylase-like metal-dependent hydrolase (beta-lactamase superfamily II)
MQDEWKEEPVSTTGAEYVEPSATQLIKPGQRVSHLFPRAIMEEFVLQRVTERVWWVTRQFYGSLFYVGKRGVLLFDPFLGGADATLAAIASVTPLPVTAVVYSHFHADHVGGSRRLFELLTAAPPRVIASEHTSVWMSRFRSDLPRPVDVLDWPCGAVRFEDVTVHLAGFPFPCHAPDHAMFLIEEERVGHTADVVNVDQLPFGGFGGQEPLVLLAANLEFLRSLEFKWFRCRDARQRARPPAGGIAGSLADRLPGHRAGPRSQEPAAVPAQQSLWALRVRQADRGRLETLLGWRGPVPDREHPRMDGRTAASR